MPLPNEIETAIQNSPLSPANISLWVAPVDGGEAMLDWQSRLPRQPASVAKMITTGMGLVLLGDDFRWRTEFYTNGLVKNGVLNGDLFIKGYGNPYFVQENLSEMVDTLRSLGIHHLAGQVVLDNSYFLQRNENPDAFDGQGMEPYNAIPNALSINFRTAKVILRSSAEGVSVTTNPELSYLRINNQMQLSSSKRCRGEGFSPKLSMNHETQTLTATGTISPACPRKELKRVIGDAGDLFFGYFKQFWQRAGGTLTGSWLYGQRSSNATRLLVVESQPLYEQIAAMNKYSNNIMTRQLFLTLGAERTQPPATLQKSRAVIKQQLKQMGVNTQGLFIENGAGLSRQTQISAQQLGHFLQAMQQNIRVAPYFEDSLSVAGVDGTLRKRLRKTALAGNAKGKTGTLDGVKSLAGYLTAHSGRRLVYVLLFEGENAKKGTQLMDDVLLWIYSNH